MALKAQITCGTPSPINHSFVQPPVNTASSLQQNYSLPIHFYIITSGGVLPGVYKIENGVQKPTNNNIVGRIRTWIEFANNAYSGAGMSFYPSAFTYYESSSLYNYGHNLQGLYNSIHDDDAINVYIVNTYTNNAGLEDGTVGETYLPSPNSPVNNVISLKAYMTGNFHHILAHELGHYFNLLHTFEPESYTAPIETNCNTQGDKICDTPQDALPTDCPNALFDCTGWSNCNSPNKVIDKRLPAPTPSNPDANVIRVFNPDKKNIMSYYDQCFLDRFSATQITRIRNTLLYEPLRAFLIQGPNPPAVSFPAENGYVYRTVLSSTGSVTTVSQFGDMNVQLSKTGVAPVTSTTLSAGGPYIVDKGIFLPQNTLAKITPTRNGSGNLAALNGVSSLDLIKVQRHILAIEFLPKPYAWIAADVNNNGVISSTDQFIMQQLILNQITAFPNVPSWRMVPTFALQNAVFLNEFNNDPFSAIWTTSTGEYLGYNQAITGGTKTYFDDLEISLSNSNINQSSTFSFQSIKSGDVNFSAIVNSASTFRSEERLPDLRTDEKYRLQAMESSCLEPGKTYSVSIAAKGDGSIYAYQMGLKFDPKLLQVSGVDRGDAKFFSLDNYNVKNLKEGELKTVWLDFEKNEKIKVNEKKDLFRMIAIPQAKVCDLSQVFQLNDQTLENLFYDENGRLIDLELIVTAQELKGEDSSNDLLLNVFPNPTSGEINFELKLQTKTKVEILLRDNFGKALTLNRTLEAGTNRLTMNEEIRSLASGIIYYTLKIGAKLYTGTFFKL